MQPMFPKAFKSLRTQLLIASMSSSLDLSANAGPHLPAGKTQDDIEQAASHQ
jgi:hypothetical protein